MASLVFARRTRGADLDARSADAKHIANTHIALSSLVEGQVLADRSRPQRHLKCAIPESIMGERVQAHGEVWRAMIRLSYLVADEAADLELHHPIHTITGDRG